MQDLISVIVPIYNVEQHLKKCLDSIYNQTYHNLEIILVDDGSPDNCGAICDEYAQKDSRIRVIHKKNGGLSDARNAGLDVMSGDYVAFVDSDDWIEPAMYETLLTNLKLYRADMAFGGVADDVEKDGKITTAKKSNYGAQPFSESSTDAMKRYFCGSWAAWDKLYKAELFDGIRYPVGEINEDEAIVLQLLDRCKRVCYTNEVFYHYMKRVGSGSITTAAFSKKKLIWKDHCAANLAFIQRNYPQLEQYAAARFRGSLLWSITEIAMLNDWSDYREELRRMMQELRERRDLFGKIPFEIPQDKIRYGVLVTFGFRCYRTLLRIKRGK